MKKLFTKAAIAISGVMCLAGCAEDVINESALVSAPTSELRVVTRQGDVDQTPLSGAHVYLFNSTNACVATFQTDNEGGYASTKLPAGTYTLCAVGGDGLSHFSLPASTSASPTSVLTLAENQTIGDLLIKSQSVTLTDGDDQTLDLTLDRKVLEISSVTINQVPDEITGVEVSVSTLYGSVQLNGDYVSDSSAPCVISLTNQGSGTWQAEPQLLAFPSKGNPVITITFSADNADPLSFSYTADAPLQANCKFNLEGTYTEPMGVILSGVIRAQSWESTSTDITFDFDNSNTSSTTTPSNNPEPSTSAPVAGSTYNDYYVVSVDETHHTALLLSKTDKTSSSEETYNAALSSFTKPENAVGDWRTPTEEECRSFLLDANTPNIRYGYNYFCLKDGELCRIKVDITDGVISVGNAISCGYITLPYIRAVIEISY